MVPAHTRTALLSWVALAAVACSGGNKHTSVASSTADSGYGDDAGDDGGVTSDSGQPCEYPPGPYSRTKQGTTIDPTLSWQGYTPGSSTPTTVTITDFFDCDGSKGINAVHLDVAALWCNVCRVDAQDMQTQMTTGSWGKDGVKPLTLIVEGTTSLPATMADVTLWKNQYHPTSVSVALAPDFFQGGPVVAPTNLLIDPRTMKIVQSYIGLIDFKAADALAQHNMSH
jgi:hypothetical protein